MLTPVILLCIGVHGMIEAWFGLYDVLYVDSCLHGRLWTDSAGFEEIVKVADSGFKFINIHRPPGFLLPVKEIWFLNGK